MIDGARHFFFLLCMSLPMMPLSVIMCTHRHQVINRRFSLKGHLRTEFCFIAQASKTNSDWIGTSIIYSWEYT